MTYRDTVLSGAGCMRTSAALLPTFLGKDVIRLSVGTTLDTLSVYMAFFFVTLYCFHF